MQNLGRARYNCHICINNRSILNKFSFTQKNRSSFIALATNEPIDLIVVGGGITGAGIALDAVLRGLKVVLLEKNDFAWGTSSRSTKLIHGGLRYLKQLEFSLVKEVGQERAVVHRNARHLVVPEKMLLPITKNGSLSKLGTSVGLYIYDFLAGVSSSERRRMLQKEATRKAEPLLLSKGLLGGGIYYEYRTDDARLTIDIIKRAVELGAICLNKAEVKDMVYSNGIVSGVEVRDVLKDETFKISSKKVVNATGPWVDLLRKQDKSLNEKRLQLTKGVHIVVPYDKFPIRQAVYFDVKDGRMIFAIPRNEKTYIGTTDTVYNQDINEPLTSKEDVKYIVKAVNKMFPSVELRENHVESTWAGLRPLIYEDGKSPSELSRKDEIFVSETGLVSIAGGKLTGYRKMAQRIVDLVAKQLSKDGSTFGKCVTREERVSGGNFDSNQAILDYIIQLAGESKQIGLNVSHIKDWMYKYGTNSGEILEIAYDVYRSIPKDPDLLALIAELHYCLQQEMVATLCDFYIRRTGALYFDRPNILTYLDDVIKVFISEFDWDEKRVIAEKEELMKEYNAVVAFKKS